MIGKRFGKWVVLRKAERIKKDGLLWWVAECECGNVKEVRGSQLRLGRSKSCGCVRNKKPWPLEKRIKSKTHVDKNGCWTGSKDRLGYGRILIERKPRLAHRVSYVVFKCPIPEDKELDHLCRVPSCVNPEHLEPVPRKENMARGYWAKKAACPAGHLYDTNNTRMTAKGHRVCRACHREREKKRKRDK